MSQLAEDLLSQADMLAKTDPRRPKAANLRRAISSAYYALFHHLIESAGQLLAGTQDSDWPLVALTTRAFNHGDMRAASRALQNGQPPEVFRALWARYGVPSNSDIDIVAGSFVKLQELRHSADYDLNANFLRAEVVAAIQRARDAIAAWERLRQQNRDLARLAALTMLLWKQLQSR